MAKRPNILLLSLDTLRADHLGCYGYGRPTSPFLDGLADGGTLFEKCFSPWIPTHPAHTSLFTGCDVMQHRITAQGARVELSPDLRMLAEILKGLGYWTGAADNLRHWFARGFDRYEGYQWAADEAGAWRKAEIVTDRALDVLEEASRQSAPFFLFAHYWDAHTPYLPPAPYERMFYEGGNERDPANRSMDPVLNFPPFESYFRKWWDGVTDIEFPKAQYDGAIAYLDSQLRRLFGRLDELGLRESTLVVITSDHGEELDEHQMWFDHHGLYDTNVSVPLLISMPGSVPAGRRATGTVRLVDILPTLLELIECADPGLDYPFQGRSFAPALSGVPETGTGDMLFLSENTWMKKRAVRTEEWKLIVALKHPDLHGCPRAELYHLLTDPRERRNVAAEHPEVVTRLRAELDAWVRTRLRETGLADPLKEQPIAMKRIGDRPRPTGRPKFLGKPQAGITPAERS